MVALTPPKVTAPGREGRQAEVGAGDGDRGAAGQRARSWELRPVMVGAAT